MEIYTSLQYWFLIIFMQFAPLNELEKGQTYTYCFVNDTSQHIEFTIKDMYFGDENELHWIIEAHYSGKIDSKVVHTAHLSHVDNEVKIMSLEKNDRFIISNPVKLPPFTASNTGILMSADKDYVLTLTNKSHEKLYFADIYQDLECEKYSFNNRDTNVDVYYGDLFGILSIVINNPTMKTYEIKRK